MQWRPGGVGQAGQPLPAGNFRGHQIQEGSSKINEGKQNSGQSGLHWDLSEVVPQSCSSESTKMQFM